MTDKVATIIFDDGEVREFKTRIDFLLWLFELARGEHGRRKLRWINHEDHDNEYTITPNEMLQ